MKALRFRVQNFRNVDDSGWIPLERVVAFVGRNESGKTSLLKALHKFNPATKEPYSPQREFPRDKYTREFKSPKDWPVCSVEFEIDEELSCAMNAILSTVPPTKATCTRYYDDSLEISYDPEVDEKPLTAAPLLEGLKHFASSARRLAAPDGDQEDEFQALRTDLATWASEWQEKLQMDGDLRNAEGKKLLAAIRKEVEAKSKPATASIVEVLQSVLNPLLEESGKPAARDRIGELVETHLPVFVYFENYGILDSAIYLPRFLEDLKRDPENPRTRTVNAMFRHVGLTAQEVAELGHEKAAQMRKEGEKPSEETIAQDQERKEARAIKLNSASIDISRRFTDWWRQRRHKIRYHADGDYFRIWIADDRRPDVEIELEARSKGFQWFFSFYLVFLVESEDGHKDAILLLDEPGLHLHPTAQQELISFFEKLSESNQLLYTTHSPFLIDGEHLHRVRPVTEDETGHSLVNADTWPADRETIFPLQAAAGYAMVRGLFRHRKNVLVEGMSDYYYLHALASQCSTSGLPSLPTDAFITPCGGTKLVGHIASLFLGQEVRPVLLLDGDDAGRVRKEALIKELYVSHTSMIIMLDDALDVPGTEVEIEDILGADLLLPAVSLLLERSLKLSEADRKAGSLPSQIKAAATRKGITLPDGWKASVAISLVSEWAEKKIKLPDDILNRAAMVFAAISTRFS